MSLLDEICVCGKEAGPFTLCVCTKAKNPPRPGLCDDCAAGRHDMLTYPEDD